MNQHDELGSLVHNKMTVEQALAVVILSAVFGMLVVAAVGCSNKKLPTQPGVDVPAAQTSVGRAEVYNTWIGKAAARNFRIVHGAMKGEWSNIVELNSGQRDELDSVDMSLQAVVRDRQSLVDQLINAKQEKIRSDEEWKGKLTEQKAKYEGKLEQKDSDFKAEHTRLKVFGWATLLWLHIIIGVLIIAALAWVVWGVYSALNPASWIAKLFFRNSFLAGPFMRYAGAEIHVPRVE